MSIQVASASTDIFFSPVNFTNNWHREDNTTTNMWQSIPAHYTGLNKHIISNSPITGTGSIYVAQLSPLTTPPNRQNHSCVWTAGYDPGALGTVLNTVFTMELRANYVSESSLGTLIASKVISGSSFTALRFISYISQTSASMITDYTKLYLRVTAIAGSESDTVDLHSFYLYVPASGSNTSNVSHTSSSSAISGTVMVSGLTNGSPVAQLLNPTGSAVKIVIYSLGMTGGGADGGSTTLCRRDINAVRRTGDPLDVGPGGYILIGSSSRLDGSLTPITGLLRGINFTNEQFYEDGSGIPCLCHDESLVQWLGRPYGVGSNTGVIPIRSPGQFPWTLMPGSAIEITWLFNGGFNVGIGAVWDEIPI